MTNILKDLITIIIIVLLVDSCQKSINNHKGLLYNIGLNIREITNEFTEGFQNK